MSGSTRTTAAAILLGLLVALPTSRDSTLQAQVDARSRSSGSGTSPAQPPRLRAARAERGITLDGRLDDAAWQAAEASQAFTQSWPSPGEAGTLRTEVRVAYDGDAIYVGVRAFDPRPDSIAAPLARRDGTPPHSDWIHVYLDSYRDRRSAFRFTANPSGMQRDSYMSNDTADDANWDAVWEVATRVDSIGWVAEFRIPFSQLRFENGTAGDERMWGVQVLRDIARRGERVAFAPWDSESGGFVSRFGDLTGLMDLPRPRRLEVLPYASAKATAAPMRAADLSNPFYERTRTAASIGADVRYGLPAGLMLTATINPDFGQVEVDPAVVNLSAFETFFPEKRPFFVEGGDVFNFGQLRRYNEYGGQTFFYTRRVGRAPQRNAGGPDISFVDAPAQTTILGAAKISGRIGPWTVGLMNALTDEERATVAGADGIVDSSTAVEPLTNFFAGRVRRDFRRGGTVVGGMFTSVNRRPAPEFDALLSHGATYGGLDFEHSWDRGQYVLSGYALATGVDGAPAFISALQRAPARYYQRPDAESFALDPSRTALTGHSSALAFQKNGAWRGSVLVREVSPGFEMNDIGFHGRVDYRELSTLGMYLKSNRTRYTQRYFLGAWTNHAWNFDATSIFQSLGAAATATFNNLWLAEVRGHVTFPAYDDRLLRGGPLAKPPERRTVNLFLRSDSRRRVVLTPVLAYTRFRDDPSWSLSSNLSIEVAVAPQLQISVAPSAFRQYSSAQYVRGVDDPTATLTYQRRYLFAGLHQGTLSLDTRINWTLSPTLSLQSYIQPFVAVGRYEGLKEFTTPRGYDFAVYGRDRGTITTNTNADGVVTSYIVDPDDAGPAGSFTVPNPNFNLHSLRGNAVLRWEYRPGSTLFVVWQQSRTGNETVFELDAARDIGAIFRERPTNILLVKAAYWFSR